MKTLLLVTALVVNAYNGETTIDRYALEQKNMAQCGLSVHLMAQGAKKVDNFTILELSCVVRDEREH